ncbi:MAG: serine hydrolase domain-containing protein [Acidobacteriota bacterium]
MPHFDDTAKLLKPATAALSSDTTRPNVLRTAAAVALTLTLAAGAATPAKAQIFGEAEPAVEAAVEDLIADFMEEKAIPGLTVAASKDGKLIMEKSYGFRDLEKQLPMYYWHRTRMGSLAKMLTAMTFMKYVEDTQDPGLLDRELYGYNGIFSTSDYPNFHTSKVRGWGRQTPVVGTVISKDDDRVYTYYDNRQFSIGTTSDLDAHAPPANYTLPPGQSPQDIQAMAAATSGHVFTWYRDGRASIGTYDDLDDTYYTTADVELPKGQTMAALVGVGMSSTNKVYAWWDDGLRTVGNYADLDFYANRATYDPAVGQSAFTIRSLAISKSDRVYAFYSDETVSRGSSTDLDAQRAPYSTDLPPQIEPEPWGSWFSGMTPRHLLNHSAGFEKNMWLTGATAMATGLPAAGDDDMYLGMELLHEYGLISGRMLFEPGTATNYSNHGGAMAGYVLEELSGIPFEVLLHGSILYPMNLHMGLAWDPITGEDSKPHWDYNKENDNPPDVVVCDCEVGVRFREQSGYLTSTAGDFLRVMMTMDLASAPSRRVLSDASIQMMETPGPGGVYGLGWWIRDAGGWLDHGGAVSGGGAAVSRFKDGFVKDGMVMDDVTVVVMANLNTPVRELSEDLAKEISQIFVNPFYDLF